MALTACSLKRSYRIRRDNWIKKQRICLLVIISLIHEIFSRKNVEIFFGKNSDVDHIWVLKS